MGNGSSEDAKGAVLIIFYNSLLIQLTWSGPLRAWKNWKVQQGEWWIRLNDGNVKL